MRTLIEFNHGLGDAVQLTSVLAHLRHYHADWQIDVAALVGKHSALTSAADRVFVLGREQIDREPYDQVFVLDWWEADQTYAGIPSTKAEKCLREAFGLQPLPELCRYHVPTDPATRQAAKHYLQAIARESEDGRRFKAVLIHYQGNTSQAQKDLDHQTARNVCEQVTAAGYVPIVLDWDNRSPLPGDGIFCPNASHWLWGGVGTGDATVLAALISQVSLYVGIDSGPGKVAAATDTPAVAVWTGHHPIHFHTLADNVLHLVPEHHFELIRGDRADGEQAFNELYRHRVYRELWPELSATVAQLLDSACDEGLVFHGGLAARKDTLSQDEVVIGDVYEHDSYSVSHLPLPPEVVVDVGAHIGCFAARWRRRNPRARILCVEACPENMTALRANVGSFAEVIQAACTYEPEQVALLNAVWPGCVSTGGSRVVPLCRLAEAPTHKAGQTEWWRDVRPLAKLTLEELMTRFQLERIDVLKLDCEGSEFSILRHATCLDRVGAIIGEYHGSAAFRALVAEKFSDWTCHLGPPDPYGNDGGAFWLFNPRRTIGMPKPCDDPSQFWSTLRANLHHMDEPVQESWREYYGTLFTLARELRPRRICEIGVRAGYSAYAMLSANPSA